MNTNYQAVAKEGEEFREIEGFNGYYYISNYGRVWSCYRGGRIMKDDYQKDGYRKIGLRLNGKTVFRQIHRLVAEAFIPNPDNKPQVNHLDENKENNHVSNLAWTTNKENIQYGTGIDRAAAARSKAVMCVETGVVYKSITEAHKLTGRDFGCLSQCAKGKREMLCGLHWVFVI